jgi:hypothetical protein
LSKPRSHLPGKLIIRVRLIEPGASKHSHAGASEMERSKSTDELRKYP